jgi:hypothetical protein
MGYKKGHPLYIRRTQLSEWQAKNGSWCKGLTKDTDERVRRRSEIQKGHKRTNFSIPWNKGLTKKDDVRLQHVSEKQSILRKGRPYWTEKQIRHKIHLSSVFSGSGNPSWKGGVSKEPYGIEFNSILKDTIRERDGHICQLCKKPQNSLNKNIKDGVIKPYKLCIHHIDYNKHNNESNNLISLCISCHSKTQFKRKFWTEYFRNPI